MRPFVVIALLTLHAVAVLATCGNGIVELGEQCDLGSSNGAASSCCAAGCTFQPATVVCRAASGPCDAPETCTGTLAMCPANLYKPMGTVCRAITGPCDAPEYCTGLSTSCPADAFLPPSTVCRPVAGDCDIAESCPGTGPNCPADAFISNTVQCRASQGDCDLPEYCTGTVAVCPPDALVVAGAVCRPANGSCDAPETCNGVDVSCPTDVLSSSSTVCRPAAGGCDIAENCTGVDPQCPADVLRSSDTVCRETDGVCDLPENCTGLSPICPLDAYVPLGVLCSAAVGECDLDAVCTGRSPRCPDNELRPGSYVCRPSQGPCDPPEYCASSNTPFCVADNIYGPSTVCRPAVGDCDVPEYCNGVPECPADQFKNATVACRASAGPCDYDDYCPGNRPHCSGDRYVPATVPCAFPSGPCTGTTYCEGHSAACPNNTLPDGTTCTLDNNLCFGDSCSGGVCVRGPEIIYSDNLVCNGIEECQPNNGSMVVSSPPLCDDGDACTVDYCDEGALGCMFALLPGIGGPCGTDVGECSTGTLQCVGTGPEPVFTCTGNVAPVAEVCGDGLDNDCDGVVDEYCTPLACIGDSICTNVIPHFSCQTAYCNGTFCVFSDRPVGTSCNDGLACTYNDTCTAVGTCVGIAAICDDLNPCTYDTCVEPYGSCSFDDAPLRGTACTLPNAFAAECNERGQCVATVVQTCPLFDPSICFEYVFNETTNSCDYVPRSGACDDGQAWTVNDVCLNGVCSGRAPNCDDGLVCTSDGSNQDTGECIHWVNGGFCYIDGVCYIDYEANPQCPCQVCNASHSQVEWTFVSTPEPCDDGDPCTVGDVCDLTYQMCMGAPLDCSTGNSACTVGECVNGACVARSVNEQYPCDDGDACTFNDACRAGTCVGDPIDYSRYAPTTGCTIINCNSTTGIVQRHADNNTLCNAGSDPCLGPFVCLAGVCTPTAPLACPPSPLPCMESVCESGYGCILRARIGQNCDDGNACTIGDVCNADGTCSPGGITLNCDDEEPCTDDFCLSGLGCLHIPVDSCTQCTYNEDCSPQLCHHVFCVEGTCQYLAHEAGTSCSDGDACNGREVCAGNGVCVNEGPLVCDDGNPCTDDDCNSLSGCYHIANASNDCDDGDACTVDDACTVNGTCVGEPYSCPGTTTCMAEQCFVVNGQPQCLHIPQNKGVWCDDATPCTHSPVCNPFGVCEGHPVACPPSTECVDRYVCVGNNTCEPVYSPIGTACRTNNLCDEYLCDGAGSCVHTAPIVACTSTDQCVASSVCIPETGECFDVHAAAGTPCDDGDACTTLDLCSRGICRGYEPVICASVDQCHAAGTCNPSTGVCDSPVLPNLSPCVDGNLCTVNSVCIDGVCTSGEPIACPEAPNQCYTARCDPHHGCLYDYLTGPCDDGNACTVDEACVEGICGGSSPVNCSHDNVCGVSYCSPTQGCLAPVSDKCNECDGDLDECIYIPCKNATCIAGVCVYTPLDSATSGCNDGVWKNGEESCFAGTCILGVPPSCDDNNPCTEDTYSDTYDGCVHRILSGTFCKSDDLCAEKAVCSSTGQCIPYERIPCDDLDDCKISLGCNSLTGACEYALKPDGSACIDNDLCSLDSVCTNGVCGATRMLNCTSDCSCREDGVCDALTGQCVTQETCLPRTCDDGNLCTLGDTCVETECRSGVYSPCEWIPHDDRCQQQICSENGLCTLENMPDYLPCATGVQTGPCSGRDVCLGGACTRLYDAGTPCRAKAPGGCDVTDVCVHGNDYCPEDVRAADGTPCRAASFCYDGVCSDGVCAPGTPRDCSDYDSACTVGVCDELLQRCVAQPIADDTQCVSGAENQCTPFSTCRVGVCTPYYANELTPCDDGDVCTRDSYCSGYDGSCRVGVTVDCSYLDTPCGTGFCDSLTGLCMAQSLSEGDPCNADDDPCTPDDTCQGGYCVAGEPLNCSYLDSSCQRGRCRDGACEVVIINQQCEPDYCDGGCVVPYQWWALHTSRCKMRSKRFTWPDGLENARICGQSYYYWSQKRARNAWRLLMHQWLAATLNEATGACVPPEIETAAADAYNLLLLCNMSINVTGPAGRTYRQLATRLNAYNSGAKHPETCLRPSCAQETSSGYFSCLFPQLNTRDVEDISPSDCAHGMWDYVSGGCNCELGWAGATCTDCGLPDADDHTFLCVPVIGDPNAFILRSIPDDDLPLYINEDATHLRQLLQLSNRVAVYPNTEGLDCACNRDIEARGVVVYGDISVYITEIERDLANCEQLFQVVVVDQNLDCDPNTTITIVQTDGSNCSSAPEDWTYICDCCGPDDSDCVCPKNDIMCLRNHFQRNRARANTFFILSTIFIGVTGLFLFVVLYLLFRGNGKPEKRMAPLPLQRPSQIKFSLIPQKRRKD